MLEQTDDTLTVTVRRLNAGDAAPLAQLFDAIAGDASARLFHPHPFTAEYAVRVATHAGKDRYLGVFDGNALVGYAMLRGWDAGYDVPSLGIYLAPALRGKSLGRTVMAELHRHAQRAGARCIRLKVYPDNRIALRLYESLGYRFATEEAGQRVGFLDLPDNKDISV